MEMNIEHLSWDSDFFNIKVGKLTIERINNFNLQSVTDEASANKYKLIYLISTEMLPTVQGQKYFDIELMDISLVMGMTFMADQHRRRDFDFKNTLPENQKLAAFEIAESTSAVSRFSREKIIPREKVKELYRVWVENALSGIYSDGLFVERAGRNVVGIHLIRTDHGQATGYFTLTGVHKNHKRQGIGRKLWDQSFSYWAEQGSISEVISPFSMLNRESLNFHLKMGFKRIESIKYIYHIRINDSF